MDWSDPRQVEIFFTLHSELPREGPGNAASTARALQLAGPLPPSPSILDIACGPGAQTIDLARLLPQARITAVDLHQPFLRELERRAEAEGFASRITTQNAGMAHLPFEAASFDLIWCEGAAYIMGVAAALQAWRPLLKPNGALALTEAVWLRPGAPEAATACWAEYPAMGDVAGLRRTADGPRYKILGDFVLPPEAWWDGYYAPLERRIASLRELHTGDTAALAILDEAQVEIDCYRNHASCYGYAFIALSKAD